MSVQRLHAFEKTSIQARHTIKRLEALMESPYSSEEAKSIAAKLLDKFNEVRSIIPEEFNDIDLVKE